MLVLEPVLKPNERPALFQPPMVRGLLRQVDPKLQTRRTMQDQPGPGTLGCYRRPDDLFIWTSHHRENNGPGHGVGISEPFSCPYARHRGDRLWVREAWRARPEFDHLPPRDIPPGSTIRFEATAAQVHPDQWGKLRPSIFMPRWACRILLEVTEIRVERLQDISEEDAIAEGCITEETVSGYDGSTIKVPAEIPHPSGIGAQGWDTAKDWYADLWESINGPGSWDLNPWVWALSFKRLIA